MAHWSPPRFKGQRTDNNSTGWMDPKALDGSLHPSILSTCGLLWHFMHCLCTCSLQEHMLTDYCGQNDIRRTSLASRMHRDGNLGVPTGREGRRGAAGRSHPRWGERAGHFSHGWCHSVLCGICCALHSPVARFSSRLPPSALLPCILFRGSSLGYTC